MGGGGVLTTLLSAVSKLKRSLKILRPFLLQHALLLANFHAISNILGA